MRSCFGSKRPCTSRTILHVDGCTAPGEIGSSQQSIDGVRVLDALSRSAQALASICQHLQLRPPKWSPLTSKTRTSTDCVQSSACSPICVSCTTISSSHHFQINFFDLILCSEVIEHIADSKRAFAEMRRLLAPSGVLILSTPQKYSPLELFSKLAFLPGIINVVRWIYKEPILETGHINLMTKRVLRDQLEQTGFAISETYTSGVYLPGIAESLGHRALRMEQALECRVRDTRFDGLLWTQFVVATVASGAE